MDFSQELNRILSEHTEIALATCVENVPNVRIVNFCYDNQRKGVLYFSTFGNNAKVKEFSKNSTVAFTSIPHTGNEHVRAAQANIQKSELTIYDLKESFVKKIPTYEITIEQAGNQLVVYEVHFEKAVVTLDFTKSSTVKL